MVAALSSIRTPVILDGISWETYLSLLRDYESRPGTHLTFDGGLLEIMPPLPEHEFFSETLRDLVVAATRALGIEVHSLRSATWKREDLQQGAEGDNSFYIQNETIVRGRKDIRLPEDPPPDLVIETDNTNSSLDKLGIYAALGVPEVWRYENGILTIYYLADNTYKSTDRSLALPILTVEDIQNIVIEREGNGQNAFLRALEDWLNERVARMGGEEKRQTGLETEQS